MNPSIDLIPADIQQVTSVGDRDQQHPEFAHSTQQASTSNAYDQATHDESINGNAMDLGLASLESTNPFSRTYLDTEPYQALWDSETWGSLVWGSTDQLMGGFPGTAFENIPLTDHDTGSVAHLLSRPQQHSDFQLDASSSSSHTALPQFSLVPRPGIAEILTTSENTRSDTQNCPRENTSTFCYEITVQLEQFPGDFQPDVKIKIKPETYQQICHAYEALCVSCTYHSPFASNLFLSHASLEILLAQYFDHFHPTIPFLDVVKFLEGRPHWLLVLATASLGCHFLPSIMDRDGGLVISLQEFLRRAVNFIDEEIRPRNIISLVEITQVRLLHALGSGYIGGNDARLFRSGIRMMGDLIIFCNSNWLSSAHNKIDTMEWSDWRRSEERLRLLYTIWLIDTMWQYHHHRPMSFTLDQIQHLPRPSPESTWAATEAAVWAELVQQQPSAQRPLFIDIIRKLYVHKIPTPVSDFEMLLSVHAILQQTWGIQRHVNQNLTYFDPDINSIGTSSNSDLATPAWPPSNPLFRKWRDSACECFDVLYNSAHKVGPFLDIEPSNAVHIHLAQLLLLAPFYHIIRLACNIAGLNKGVPLPSTASHALEDQHIIKSWMETDLPKVRQCLVHSGMIFWHARRLSVENFYEPTAAAFATFISWAACKYSPDISGKVFSSSKRRVAEAENNGSSSEEENDFMIILLDRPSDQELVRSFIQSGQEMQAVMEGVGNLSSSGASRKVLKKGLKMLEQMTGWRRGVVGWSVLIERVLACQ